MTVQSFFPRRSVINVRQEMMAFYNVATNSAGGNFSIQASSFYQPYANVSVPLGSTGANKSNLTLTSSYATTQSPIGYTEYASLYSYYKVRKSRVVVTMIPSNTQDSLVLCGFYSPNQETVFNPIYPSAQPGGKRVMALTGAPPKNLSLTASSPSVLGYTGTQFEGLAPTLMGNSPSSTTQWYFNFTWYQLDGTSPASLIGVNIDLYQEVEVSELAIFTV